MKIAFDFDLHFKKISEDLRKTTVAFKEKYPETKNNYYPQELINVFEKHIEVYGHAYCMDIGSERKKLSKLLYGVLSELKE